MSQLIIWNKNIFLLFTVNNLQKMPAGLWEDNMEAASDNQISVMSRQQIYLAIDLSAIILYYIIFIPRQSLHCEFVYTYVSPPVHLSIYLYTYLKLGVRGSQAWVDIYSLGFFILYNFLSVSLLTDYLVNKYRGTSERQWHTCK